MPASYHDDGIYDPRPPSSAPAVRRVRPDPEGTQILDGFRRVGTVRRNTYLEHLSDLHARGYFPTDTEYEARRDAALKAETEYDLNRLIADTPGLVEPTVSSAKRALHSPAAVFSWLAKNGSSPALIFPLFAAWLFGTVAWATIVPAALGAYSSVAGHQPGFHVGMVVFFIITAIVSFVIEVATFVEYIDG